MSELAVEDTSVVTNPPQESNKFGRRSFLKALGISTAGLLTNSSYQTDNTTATVEPILKTDVTITPEKKLAEVGLKEFIPFYYQSKYFYEKWGIHPPIFSDIRMILEDIINDNPEALQSELYANLVKDWGTKLASKQQVPSSKIDFGADVNEDKKQRIENISKNILESFPIYQSVIPQKIEYKTDLSLSCGVDAKNAPVLGCTDNKSFVSLGNETEESFASTFIHELNHNLLDNFGQNTDIFQYTRKTDVINYYTGTISILDRFLTSVAEDTSTKPSEYTYGFINWKDRADIRENLAKYKSLLGIPIEDSDQPTKANYTTLPEDPQYNLVVRNALKNRLSSNPPSNITAEAKKSLDKLILSEFKFLYHNLHNIQLTKFLQLSENQNTVVQQFLDLTIQHQRLLLPLISGGILSGSSSINAFRESCGLNKIVNNTEKIQRPWDFDYKDYGCQNLLETGSEYIRVKAVLLPECPTDLENQYIAVDISSRFEPQTAPHTLLLSIPNSLTIQDWIITDTMINLLFSDNSKVSIKTSVTTDPSSANYGNIAILKDQIETENPDIGSLLTTKSLESNIKMFDAQCTIGRTGTLSEQKRIKKQNIPTVAFYDSNNNIHAYETTSDVKQLEENTILFQANNTDDACIINTAQGYKLIINSLPAKRKYNTVQEAIADIKQYNATIIGEDKLSTFADTFSSLNLHAQGYPSDQTNKSEIVTSSIVAQKNGQVKVFPIDIDE